MPAVLRAFLFGCIAVAIAYLALHVTEPLRLTVGDPWSDAELVSSLASDDHVVVPTTRHTAPLVVATYRAIAAFGLRDVGALRVFALGWSLLGVWWLFRWLRAMWGTQVAAIGTALYTTSAAFLMFADSLQAPPIAQAACFFALWSVVRAIETAKRRYLAAAALGAFLCMFASSDHWLVLAAGVLVTVSAKRGNALHTTVCALGYAVGTMLRARYGIEALDWLGSVDRLPAPLAPTLTVAFSPLVWLLVIHAAWRLLRAASLRAAFDDAMSWLVAIAVLVTSIFAQSPVPPAARALPILPLFAIAGALAIERLLQRGGRWRGLASALVVGATMWGFWAMLSQPRPVLDRDDVTSAREYLAYNDGNDFVMTNLLSDGVVDGALDRHSVSVIADVDMSEHAERLQMLQLLESAGVDYLHAVIFTSASSRMGDRALAQLAALPRKWTTTQWPALFPDKARSRIASYDAEIREHLAAIGAWPVLHFDEFDIYRVERRVLLDRIARPLPVTQRIELNSYGSIPHTLLGWDELKRDPRFTSGSTSILGHGICASPVARRSPDGNRCELVQTREGAVFPDERFVDRAELVIRVDRVCDLRVTVQMARPRPGVLAPVVLATSPRIGVSMNGFVASSCDVGELRTFVVPRGAVRPGSNVVMLSTQQVTAEPQHAAVRALAIDPQCD